MFKLGREYTCNVQTESVADNMAPMASHVMWTNKSEYGQMIIILREIDIHDLLLNTVSPRWSFMPRLVMPILVNSRKAPREVAETTNGFSSW